MWAGSMFLALEAGSPFPPGCIGIPAAGVIQKSVGAAPEQGHVACTAWLALICRHSLVLRKEIVMHLAEFPLPLQCPCPERHWGLGAWSMPLAQGECHM